MKCNRPFLAKAISIAVILLSIASCGVFDPLDPYVKLGRWAASYGGSLDETINSIATDDAGALYAAGHTETFGAGNGDAWLIKTANDGTIVWQKAYNYDTNTSETFKKIRLSQDGTATALCDIASDGKQSFAIMNIGNGGDVSWYHLFGGNSIDTAEDCIRIPLTGTGYLITGHINSFTISIDSSGSGDAFLLAVDGSGNFLWQKIYGGPGYYETKVLLPCSDGGVYLAGNTASCENRKSDYWLVKTDSHGVIEWQKAFGGGGDEYLCAAAASSGDTILLAGISTSSDVMIGVQQKSSVYWILCLDNKGDIIWQKTYYDPLDKSVPGKDTVCSIRESTVQNRYVVALSATLDTSGPDYCLLILGSDGSIQNQKRYGGSDSDEVRDVVYMKDHCSLVAGSTRSFGGGRSDFWFLKALPNLECAPLTEECGFVENAASGAAVSTLGQTRTLSDNPLEALNSKNWTTTDTRCTVRTQAP